MIIHPEHQKNKLSRQLSLISTILLLLYIGIQASAQENTSIDYYRARDRYLIGFMPSAAENIYGIAIGPVGSEAICNRPYTKRSHGINIQLIGQGIFQAFYIRQTEKVKLLSGDTVPGRDSIVVRSLHNGLLISSFGTFTSQLNGLSISPWMSMGQKVNGISLNLIWNFYHKVNGLSIGLFNDTGTSHGLQIGLFNNSKKLKGIQIGLWNKNDKRSLPLINWDF